jgi:hypothetical protein
MLKQMNYAKGAPLALPLLPFHKKKAQPELGLHFESALYRDALLFVRALLGVRLARIFSAAFLQRSQRDVKQRDEQQVQRSCGEHAAKDRSAYGLTPVLAGSGG